MKRILILIMLFSASSLSLYAMQESDLEGDEKISQEDNQATIEERVEKLENDLENIKEQQSHFATHEEYTDLANGLAENIEKIELKIKDLTRPNTNTNMENDELFDELDGLLIEIEENAESKKPVSHESDSRGKIVTPNDEVDLLLISESNPNSKLEKKDKPKTRSLPQAPSFDSSLLMDLAPQMGNMNNPSIAGAVALIFHLIGGKERIKEACGKFNEPTKKAVAQLVEGAVLANVFNATWPKLSNGESRDSWAYTALFVGVHVSAKLLKPYILKKLGMRESDPRENTQVDQKNFIKDLKNNTEWVPLLAQAAFAYALTPLLIGK